MDTLKKRLLDEKALLEKELSKIGRKDSAAPGGWDAVSGKMDIDSADDNEVADKLEAVEENSGIVEKLEGQLKEVNDALDKMGKGTYGICEKSGKPIEIERLHANPSARFSLRT